jgi:tripartite-type tricarboxylate transporter receptor subunit TctC
MHAPDAMDLLRKNGFTPEDMGPDQFAAFAKSEVARWSAVVSSANLKE